MPPVLKVSQLNRYVKSQLESDSKLREVYVSGEIATLSVNARSGHVYFSLCDSESSVRAVMFAKSAALLRFMPQSGLAVVARGSASLYERDGVFQLIVYELMLDGASQLGMAFEKQKKLLEAKGYFDESRKRPIPQNPAVIGVVTSESGAALHDIISVIERRNPSVKIILAPAAVQGKEAPRSVADAIRRLVQDGRSEVIIVGRGGGSAEDLWAFNDEEAVKAVYMSPIPVISAVGHETDVTLCDFAADLRAATPTAAAELAVYDRERLIDALDHYRQTLSDCMDRLIAAKAGGLNIKKDALSIKNPEFFIDKNRQRLNNLISLLHNHANISMAGFERELNRRAALLEGVSPLKVLARGYCIAQLDNKAVLSSEELKCGDELELLLHSGAATARVTAVKKD